MTTLQQISPVRDLLIREPPVSKTIGNTHFSLVCFQHESRAVNEEGPRGTFPIRGVQRDDIRPGLRITNYKRRAVIAFAVSDEEVRSSVCSTAAGTTNRYCKTMTNREQESSDHQPPASTL